MTSPFQTTIQDYQCEWFARCTNPADGVVDHPVLNLVPTCTRCATKFDLKLLTVEV